MEWMRCENNYPQDLQRFARDGLRLYKIYDAGDDWYAVTHFSDGTKSERYYSKWRDNLAESLLRAEQRTAPCAQWTSA